MEVLIVIALIGMVGGMIAIATGDMLDAAKKPAPYEVLRKAVDAAWYAAATGNKPVELAFNADATALVLGSLASTHAPATAMETFPFEDARVRSVRFLNTRLETPLPRVLFSPWGGATPAIIEMDLDGTVFRYALEIFSGALEPLQR